MPLDAVVRISTAYYVRLEQGRYRHPSTLVLDALARALQLDEHATAHLHQLAAPTSAPSFLTVNPGDRFRGRDPSVLDRGATVSISYEDYRAALGKLAPGWSIKPWLVARQDARAARIDCFIWRERPTRRLERVSAGGKPPS